MGVSALSDQLAAGAITMGERLGSDDARCAPLGRHRVMANVQNGGDARLAGSVPVA